MKSSRVPAFALGALALTCAAVGADPVNPNVVAKAGGQQLSVTRLSDLLGNASGVPIDKNVARAVAMVWVNYHLLGAAAARGDSLMDRTLVNEGLRLQIENMRLRKLYENVSRHADSLNLGTNEQRYLRGELLGARHILVLVDSNATPEQVQAAQRRAEAIRAEATPANFASLAASKSDEPGAAEKQGMLGLFAKGEMVPEFERAVLATKIGEISPVIRTDYGFHVIYRLPFTEVAQEYEKAAPVRNMQVAESLFVTSVESGAAISVSPDAGARAKAIALNPLGARKDSTALARYKGGEVTAAEFSAWVSSQPSTAQIAPRILSGSDADAERYVRGMVRFELLLRRADSLKTTLTADEYGDVYRDYRSEISLSETQLAIDPKSMADSAKAGTSRQAIAAARIEAYFDKVVRNEVPFVEMTYPLTHVLQSKYSFVMNESVLDKVIQRAMHIRAASDSIRAKSAPVPGSNPSAVPTPAGMMAPPNPKSRGGN